MNPSNILVIPKKSAVQMDNNLSSLSEQELIEKYPREYESHLRQQQVKKQLKEKFNNFLTLDDLTKDEVKKYDTVLTASGDDFFNAVTHHIDDTLIIGLNSDTKLSDGNLLSYSINDLDYVLENLKKDNYSIEEWTRAKITLNDKEIELTTSVTPICNVDPVLTTKYDLYLNGKYIKQSGSGLLIVTGVGSTNDWHKFYGETFGKQEKKIAFVVREYKGEMPYGVINKGDELKIIYKKDNGKISVDSFDKHTHYIKRNDEIKVSVSDKPLKVIRV